MAEKAEVVSSHFFRRVMVVLTFALAMAYLESAVVVYLQRALSMTPETLFPLRSKSVLGNLGAIEVGREFATLVMLVAVGWLAGRCGIERFAWVAVAFGIWDIGYYFFLWIFIGWPTGLGTYDLLFLIPVPWVAPVWAPMLVSVALIFFGLAIARRSRSSSSLQLRLRDGGLMVCGGVIVIFSFTWHFRATLSGAVPTTFAWPIFTIGMALAVLGISPLYRTGRRTKL